MGKQRWGARLRSLANIGQHAPARMSAKKCIAATRIAVSRI